MLMLMRFCFLVVVLAVMAFFVYPRPADAAGAKIYVALYNEGGISVVDPASLDSWGLIKTKGAVAGLAVSTDGKRLFASLINEQAVQVIDTETDKVVKEIKVGLFPYHVAVTPDGRYVLVCNSGDTNLSVIDAAKLEVTGKVELGAMPFHVAFSADGKLAYVALGEEEKMGVVDLGDMKVKSEPAVPAGVYDVVVSKSGDLVYINSLGGKQVLALSSDDMKAVKTIKAYGIEGLALTPDGKEVWFGGPEKSLSVYSLEENKAVGELLRGNQSTYLQITLSPDGAAAFITPSGEEQHEIYVYDTASKELKGRIKLPQTPRGLVYIEK